MTNRTKPGPGMGPSWKELVESGELQRILDRGQAQKPAEGTEQGQPVCTDP
jgi:hypothetical protein